MTAETGRLYCFNCHQIIVGQYYTFGTHHYHSTCFTCEKCKKSLVQGFYNRGEHLLCDKCYTVVVSHKLSKCPFCKQVVGVGKSVKALGHSWHVDCFVCRDCKKHIDKEYYNVGRKVYCKECYTNNPPSEKEEVPMGATAVLDPSSSPSTASHSASDASTT